MYEAPTNRAWRGSGGFGRAVLHTSTTGGSSSSVFAFAKAWIKRSTAAASSGAGSAIRHVSHGQEVRRTEPVARFEDRSLRPFIPCVDEHESPFQVAMSDRCGGNCEPPSECVRVRSEPHVRIPLSPCGVVEGDHDPGEVLVADAPFELGDRVLDHRAVAQDVAAESWRRTDVLMGQPVPAGIVGREAERAVEAFLGHVALEALELPDHIDVEDEQVADALLPRDFAPLSDNGWEVRDLPRTIDRYDRSTIDSHVARVAQDRQHVTDELARRHFVVPLSDEDVGLPAIPPAGPVLVGPHQAEGKSDAPRESAEDRRLEELFAGEPIVVVHEARYAG